MPTLREATGPLMDMVYPENRTGMKCDSGTSHTVCHTIRTVPGHVCAWPEY